MAVLGYWCGADFAGFGFGASLRCFFATPNDIGVVDASLRAILAFWEAAYKAVAADSTSLVVIHMC